MPPKKKQEEIDIQSLPPWTFHNIIFTYQGKSQRANRFRKFFINHQRKFLKYITRKQIIDYAKEKGLYVDPTTITQKQKKDAKLMAELPLQLSSGIVAKAAFMLINDLNIKGRIEKKHILQGKDQPQKKQQKKGKKQTKKKEKEEVVIETPKIPQKLYNKNFDCIYVLNNFPQQQVSYPNQEFQEFSKLRGNILLFYQIKQKLVWNASQMEERIQEIKKQKQEQILQKQREKQEKLKNQQQQQSQQVQINVDQEIEQQQDLQLKQYMITKSKESFTQQQIKENILQKQIFQKAIQCRTKTQRNLQVRDILMKQFIYQVDPYAPEQSFKIFIELLLENICDISLERIIFEQWYKSKKTLGFKTHQMNQFIKPTFFILTPLSYLLYLRYLMNIGCKDMYQKNLQQKQNQQINKFFQDMNQIENKISIIQQLSYQQFQSQKFIHHSQNIVKPHIDWNNQRKLHQLQLIRGLRFLGIERQGMPQISQRSKQLRISKRARIMPFITCTFTQFQHRMSIMYFQWIMRLNDQFRKEVNFSDRKYIEKYSIEKFKYLMYKLSDQEMSMVMRYNKQQDKLYCIYYYRYPPGLTLHKSFNSPYKVLPNFQHFLQYFNNNEEYLKNQDFYDLDYQRYGNIGCKTKLLTLENKDTIVWRQRGHIGQQTWERISGYYWGMDQQKAWYYIKGIKLTFNIQNQVLNSYITLNNGLVIKILHNNSFYQYNFQHSQQRIRYLSTGDVIIYGQNTLVYHPSGCITNLTKRQTINTKGLKIKYSQTIHKQQQSCCSRYKDGKKITRRYDQTVLLQQQQQSWIQFKDGTKFHKTKQKIRIEREGFASVQVLKEEFVCEISQRFYVKTKTVDNCLQYSIHLQNGTELLVKVKQAVVQIIPLNSQAFLELNIKNKIINLKDTQKNELKIFNKGNIQLNTRQKLQQQQEQRPSTPDFNEAEFVQQQVKQLPIPKLYKSPRLFKINDKQVLQYLTDQQFNQRVREGHNVEILEVDESKQFQGINMSIIKEVKQELKRGSINIPFPQIDIYKPVKIKQKPEKYLYQIYNLIKTFEFTVSEREEIRKNLQDYFTWKKQYVKEGNEFGQGKSIEGRDFEMERKKQFITIRKIQKQQQFFRQIFNKVTQLLKERQMQTKQKQVQLKNQKPFIDQEEDQIEEQNLIKSKIKIQISQQATSRKLSMKKDVFLYNYFDTIEGQQALENMDIPPFPQLKPRFKVNQQQQNIEPISQRKQSVISKKNLTDQIKIKDISPYTSQEIKKIIIKPSVFTQAEIDEEKKQLEKERQAARYKQSKRKQMNVYQQPRQKIPQVPVLERTQPISELNQKYILTQSIAENKVKISSMKNKISLKAPGLAEIRTQGMHQTMLKAIDKKYKIEELIEKKNLMIEASLNDKLRRDLLVKNFNQIKPAQVDFGYLKQGNIYQTKVEVKNQDLLAQRINIKKFKNIYVRVFTKDHGPVTKYYQIALGINRIIYIQIKTTQENKGKFNDQFQIVTKHQIYKIPIKAIIMSQQTFNRSSRRIFNNVKLIKSYKKQQQNSNLLPHIKSGKVKSNEQSLQLQ